MIDPKAINEFIQKIIDEMPQGLKNIPVEMQHNFKSALQCAFEKCDLVTREEFEMQCKVLQRTREKLERLEKLIAELESGDKK